MATIKEHIKQIEKKNNYYVKTKGSDVSVKNPFNNALAIISKGLINYFLEDKDFITTIKENQDLIDYQIVKKRTAKTIFIDFDTMTTLDDKVLRLFPVTNDCPDKKTIKNDKGAKVPNVPEYTILVKENIIGKTINDIDYFDLNYYIETFNDSLIAWSPKTVNEE